MAPLIYYFLNLCLFRAGPQDAPGSDNVLVASGILLALSYALINTPYQDVYFRFLVAAIQVLVFGLAVWLVLRIRRLGVRWRQTMVALYGSAILLELMKLPVILAYPETESIYPGLPGPFFMHVVGGLWYLAIMTHVLRLSLDTSVGRGIAAAIFCQLMTVFGMLILLKLIGLEAFGPGGSVDAHVAGFRSG